MRKAIVTGANGFIGTELCAYLTGKGVKVYAVVRSEASYSDELRAMKNLIPIMCEMDNLSRLMNKVDEVDVFYHLVWAGVSGNDRGNCAIQLNNIRWTMDAIAVAKEIGCKRFVGAGTMAEHDVYNYAMIDGSTPNLVSEYGAAKLATHFMSKAECNAVGLEHLWAIIPNTYGIGDKSSNFINFAYNMIVSDSVANFTSGEQYYDFVYVTDVAKGLYCIGEYGKKNYSYYIGSGAPRKLKDYIVQIRDIVNPEKEINLGAIPFNGISAPVEVFDCSKLETDTGYQAGFTFEKGMQLLKQWRVN